MVKTFPIVMDDKFHERLQKAAEQLDKPIKTLILEAIEAKIIEVENEK
jgi:predicted DNA-binding protein